MMIKLILLVALAGAAYLLVHGRKSALRVLMRRSLTLVAILAGALAVLFPGDLTKVAQLVGVGRGADLLLYLLCVAFLFMTIAFSLRLKEMEDRFVLLARKHALLEAELNEQHRQPHPLDG